MYRRSPNGQLEVFLAHPGGPFFAKKDAGAWSIPKGELGDSEEALACALREFEEETGMRPSAPLFLELGSIKQRGGKVIEAWAFEGEWGDRELRANHFELEWPPRSGHIQSFPEVDRVAFFSIDSARQKLNPAQVELIDRLCAKLQRPSLESS